MNFFWDGYKQALKQEIDKRVKSISSGKADSFARYKEVTGEIRGLKMALTTLDNCLKRAGEIEDEQDT